MAKPRQFDQMSYTVALICPLPIETSAARLMFDEVHGDPLIDTRYDDNQYTCGSINNHNVVIATMPLWDTGVASAGHLINPLTQTFTNLRVTLLVGIGGGIPHRQPKDDPNEDIHLGDVVIGWNGNQGPAIIQWDAGNRYRDGKISASTNFPPPDRRILGSISKFQANHFDGITTLQENLNECVKRSKKPDNYGSPGPSNDKLYKATNHHQENGKNNCDLCGSSRLVDRKERSTGDFQLHFGTIASGSSVIEDPEIRDKIRDDANAICVEMEAAGVLGRKNCLVIRGISDYADSHKNDKWKPYAATTAAVVAREILYIMNPGVIHDLATPYFIPFRKNEHFVGRESLLKELDAKIFSPKYCQRIALFGLGGVGKTQVALELAYYEKERSPGRAIFWVPAISKASFEQAYLEIGKVLQIPGITEEKADVKRLVKMKLSDESFGEWLLIIDNADDTDMPLIDWLPDSRKGSIIFTTRTRKAAMKQARTDIVLVPMMNQVDAKKVLEKALLRELLSSNENAVVQLLELLACLPLAIVQAAAYMNENDISVSEYIALYKGSEEDTIELLSEDFEDQGSYRDTKNPVAKTWLISFEQIRRQDLLAAEYLSFMACLNQEHIPRSLLPPPQSPNEMVKAIGTLTAYSFVIKRTVDLSFVHRLVYLATRDWLRREGQLSDWTDKALGRLVDMSFTNGHEEIATWAVYLPHALYVAASSDLSADKKRKKITLLDNIERCLQHKGQREPADIIHRWALELKGEVPGKEHPSALLAMSNVPLVLGSQSEHEEVEQMHQESLVLREKTLHQAEGNNHKTIVRPPVKEEADVEVKDRLPVLAGIEKGSKEDVSAIKDPKNSIEGQSTPLHLAARNGQPEAIKALFAAEAEINTRDKNQ